MVAPVPLTLLLKESLWPVTYCNCFLCYFNPRHELYAIFGNLGGQSGLGFWQSLCLSRNPSIPDDSLMLFSSFFPPYAQTPISTVGQSPRALSLGIYSISAFVCAHSDFLIFSIFLNIFQKSWYLINISLSFPFFPPSCDFTTLQ